MPGTSDARQSSRPPRLWLWVGIAFAVQLAAWAIWLIIAAQNPVQEVPLAPVGPPPIAR